MSLVAANVVDLARAQFATTSIYHFFFVPLTLGLGPIVAVMQTMWHRTRDERWLRLTHFFGTLFLINFAIGVATGLVQEFQFGMNWSVYSKFVGNVFGAPLAIEGLAAFFLEATFLGVWIFGWNRLSPRLHLATLWIAVLGTWMSAYFILVANSFMQDPVGLQDRDGEAQLTSVWALLSSDWALWAFGHTILAGLTAGSAVVFGVCCWHFAARPQPGALPAGGEAGADRARAGRGLQPLVREPLRDPRHRAPADEDLRRRGAVGHCGPCSFSLFQIGGFTERTRRRASRSRFRTRSRTSRPARSTARSPGLTELNQQYEAMYGPGNYMPPVRTIYWSMRVMAYAGSFVALVALVGAFLLWKRRLERLRWFLWIAVVTTFLPFVAITAGWMLTEVGRQPWIVQGLLKTADANSPAVSSAMLVFSLAVFVCLYALLLVLDIWLMRRYARVDPPELDASETGVTPMPAIGY